MPQRDKIELLALERPSWRDYQASLKSAAIRKKISKIIIKFSALIFILFVMAYGIFGGFSGESSCPALISGFFSSDDKKIDTHLSQGKLIGKSDVQALLESTTFVNLKNKSFDFISDDLKFRVDTSIDTALQNFLLKKLKLSTSRYIGIVGMDPATGKILSMIGFDKTNGSNNPCLDNRFPAASIFKIVTASAASLP